MFVRADCGWNGRQCDGRKLEKRLAVCDAVPNRDVNWAEFAETEIESLTVLAEKSKKYLPKIKKSVIIKEKSLESRIANACKEPVSPLSDVRI